MKLKVFSDGSPSGTRIYDEDTGKDLSSDIEKIVWKFQKGEKPSMVITFNNGRADIVCHGWEWTRLNESQRHTTTH